MGVDVFAEKLAGVRARFAAKLPGRIDEIDAALSSLTGAGGEVARRGGQLGQHAEQCADRRGDRARAGIDGTLTSSGRTFTLSLKAENRSWFGDLLGRPRRMFSEDSPGQTPLWHVAFTRHGEAPQRVPIKQACGRYVDWFAPTGSHMT